MAGRPDQRRRKVGAARRRLVESGLPEERLRRFPAEQVILLDEKREFEVRRDDIMKMMALPAWQAEALSPAQTEPAEIGTVRCSPARGRVRHRLAQARLDQRIALLRHVEACDCTPRSTTAHCPRNCPRSRMPLPDDPFTGKPFRYEVNGNVRTTRQPTGEHGNDPDYKVQYKVTVRK